MRPRRIAVPLLALPLLALPLLAGCSSDGDASPTSSATATPTGQATSATSAPAPTVDPADLTLACALADDAQVAAVEALMKPDFAVSQLVVVSAAETDTVAVLGYVEGPGKYILAQWVSPSPDLNGIAAVEENTVDVSDTAIGFPDEIGAALVAELASCYTEQFAPEQ